jgi:hypothetical protein
MSVDLLAIAAKGTRSVGRGYLANEHTLDIYHPMRAANDEVSTLIEAGDAADSDISELEVVPDLRRYVAVVSLRGGW